ncbi:MAG: DUF3382 domain-containing protein, partial [Gammaproteobacteria bacterium]|nr:DUF3382 domain-containing protein [Gammaproteobacteria bacterium]
MGEIRRKIINATVAGSLTALLAVPIIGTHIVSEPGYLGLEWDGWKVLIAVVAVFLVQLFSDQIRGVIKLTRHLPDLTPALRFAQNRRLVMMLLLFVALIWPFYASRGSVDLATLALIYIMMGLGLNIVVGFAGLLDLGYVAFYAVGAYSYALLSQYFGVSFWLALPLSGLMAGLF